MAWETCETARNASHDAGLTFVPYTDKRQALSVVSYLWKQITPMITLIL